MLVKESSEIPDIFHGSCQEKNTKMLLVWHVPNESSCWHEGERFDETWQPSELLTY